MWRLFGPKRTLSALVEEIVEGIENGTVVIPGVLPAAELTPELTPPPVLSGPFRRYSAYPLKSSLPSRKRVIGETVREPGRVVDSWDEPQALGYARV